LLFIAGFVAVVLFDVMDFLDTHSLARELELSTSRITSRFLFNLLFKIVTFVAINILILRDSAKKQH